MSSSKQINRRRFLNTTAAFTIVPRTVLGGRGFVAPSERLNVGYVGAGTQGLRQLMQALPKPELQIVSICDPNKESFDYIEWSRNELRNKVRRFLKKPSWGEGSPGCRCGRLMGQELVDGYYAAERGPSSYKGCEPFADFREMLAKVNDLDAVYIMPPDHLHATVAMAAMKKGKHVISHKPISNVLHETTLAVETARNAGVTSQMFCSADSKSTPQLCEWIWGGAIGQVREVHNWSSRPFWPQGMTAFPSEKVAIPDGLQWDLWLGPVPDRPYHPALTHAVFRGWYDFGAGALGDMGHYSFFQIFKILKLGFPTTVEASRSQYWAIVDYLWQKQQNLVSYPRASMIQWEFPARGEMAPVTLHWYDGGLRPPVPAELEEDDRPLPQEGLLFVGDSGKILADFGGGNPRLIPEARMRAFQKPAETLPRPIDELDQWIRGCRGEKSPDASFPAIEPFCESICLGNIALRVSQKLKWDSSTKRFTNSEEANALMKRAAYRPGWEL